MSSPGTCILELGTESGVEEVACPVETGAGACVVTEDSTLTEVPTQMRHNTRHSKVRQASDPWISLSNLLTLINGEYINTTWLYTSASVAPKCAVVVQTVTDDNKAYRKVRRFDLSVFFRCV